MVPDRTALLYGRGQYSGTVGVPIFYLPYSSEFSVAYDLS